MPQRLRTRKFQEIAATPGIKAALLSGSRIWGMSLTLDLQHQPRSGTSRTVTRWPVGFTGVQGTQSSRGFSRRRGGHCLCCPVMTVPWRPQVTPPQLLVTRKASSQSCGISEAQTEPALSVGTKSCPITSCPIVRDAIVPDTTCFYDEWACLSNGHLLTTRGAESELGSTQEVGYSLWWTGFWPILKPNPTTLPKPVQFFLCKHAEMVGTWLLEMQLA